MSSHFRQPPSVVVNIFDGSNDHVVQNAAEPTPVKPRVSSEQMARSGRKMDPHEAHLEWPSLWSEFLRSAFRGPLMVERICMQFHVNERTVRKWLSSEGGCNGRHVRVAMDYDPTTAMRTLFGMAAE